MSNNPSPHHDDTDDFMAFMRPSRPEQPMEPEQTEDDEEKRPPRKKMRWILWFVILLILLGSGYLFRIPLLGLLYPPSPFSSDIKENYDFPLYYPTKLPGSFKIETGSFTYPEADVIIFRVSDDEGKVFFISQQAANDNIDINALFEGAPEPRQVQYPLGNAWIGTNTEGIVPIHMTTDTTWLILTMDPGVLTEEDINLVFRNIRKG